MPSASLVPENDPTTLFTGSGMQPLVPYLLGKNHPAGNKLVNSQKCFRAMDIEEVGDNRHTTFFEMIGNWSFGDYFKEEQLAWFFAFLTQEVGLSPERLYVSVFAGDEKLMLPRDEESVKIWKHLFAQEGIDATDVELLTEEEGGKRGMQGGRIFYFSAKKNWWSRSGVPETMPAGEPGGPDSEVFFDFYPELEDKCLNSGYGPYCHPNCDCGRFMEIGNSVFMQYRKNENGTFDLLPKQNVDFGGGLERIVAARNGDPDVFTIDTFKEMIRSLEQLSGSSYGDPLKTRSFRVVADHIRAAVFLIGDGVNPGNVEREYFVRRLIRRAVRHADKLGLGEGRLDQFVLPICNLYSDEYVRPRVAPNEIANIIKDEETKFRKTLRDGLKEFEKISGSIISGHDAFILFSTYGFPIELTEELAKERGQSVEMSVFREEMKKHQELSRAGSEQKFKGGLADHSLNTVRLHTAHHLLLRALQIVLGENVHQRGSNITQERLRIDFSYGQKMTDEQKTEVERIVNEKIAEQLPVIRSEMSRVRAEELGAEHEFGQKYPEMVSVYSVGPKDATQDDPKIEERFSIEFCGGPHVNNTSELGKFKILKEEAVAQGVRRIKAILE
jgi:alanyl-tRNA synthetase